MLLRRMGITSVSEAPPDVGIGAPAECQDEMAVTRLDQAATELVTADEHSDGGENLMSYIQICHSPMQSRECGHCRNGQHQGQVLFCRFHQFSASGIQRIPCRRLI